MAGLQSIKLNYLVGGNVKPPLDGSKNAIFKIGQHFLIKTIKQKQIVQILK